MHDEDEYIFWCGHGYRVVPGSRRSRVLEAAAPAALEPVPLREAYLAAERTVPGLTSNKFRADIRKHHGTRGCVYLELRRRPDGAFISVRRIPEPHPAFGFAGPIDEGAVVVPAGTEAGERRGPAGRSAPFVLMTDVWAIVDAYQTWHNALREAPGRGMPLQRGWIEEQV